MSACMLGVLMLAMSCAAAAQDYWTYSYQQFEVLSPGDAARAVSLAHDLARFDTAVSRILQLPESRLPTQIFELSESEQKKIIGEGGSSRFAFDGYQVTVIAADNNTSHAQRYWGALFGYAGSLLMNGTASRYPFWFQLGVPQLLAHGEFDSDKITMGATVQGYGNRLLMDKRLPMRTFLGVTAADPRLKQGDFMQMFEAQSWYLARLVYVEGVYRSEFSKYCALISDGKTADEAFTASFSISYEQLDAAVTRSLSQPQHMFVVKVPQVSDGAGSATRLTAPQLAGRLALLAARQGPEGYALQLAAQSLAADPANEAALRALALASLRDKKPQAALAAVDRLAALPAPSAEALSDMGSVLSRLARPPGPNEAPVGDSAALLTRAREAYEKATQLDPECLRAWAGLAYSIGRQHDVEAAQGLVKRAAPVMEKHLHNGALAQALALLCANTHQSECAFLYGEYWRDDAVTVADHERAQAFMSQLH